MNWWIDIETSAGVLVGSGPIASATSATVTARLNRAGSFSFSMPAGDPKAAYCTAHRIARIRTLINGTVADIGAGVIDRVALDAAGLNLTISGDDLLRELTYRQVGALAISGKTGPQSIIALAPGSGGTAWSLDVVTGDDETVKTIAHTYARETVLEAFCKLAEMTGERFRLGAGRTVVWLQNDETSTTLRAVANGDPYALQSETGLVIIRDLRQEQDTYDNYVGRLYAYGTGNGGNELTLNGASTSYSGYTISNDAKGYYLEHTATWNTYGIEASQMLKDTPEQATLVERAYEWMKKQISAVPTYRLQVLKADASLPVGNTLRVVYRRVVDDYVAVDINAQLVILETTTQIDAAGVRVVSMLVSASDRYPVTDALATIQGMGQSQSYYVYPQAAGGGTLAGAGTAGYIAKFTNSSTLGDAGASRIGGSSNYVAIDADGVITYAAGAKRRLSMRPTMIPGKISTPQKPTPIDRGAASGFSLPLYAADEEIFFNEYIAGRWDGASDITCSVIGYLDTAETDGDDFALQLSWWNKSTGSGTWPNTTNDVVVETDCPAPRNAQYSIFRVDFTIDWDLPATDVTASDFFAARLRRIAVAGGGAVEIAGEFVVVAVVISYTVDKVFKAP